MTTVQTSESIIRQIGVLEAAIADVDEAIEQLQTAQPPSDEGRDAQREAIEQARARVAILRSRAANGQGSPRELAAALSDLENAEAGMLPDDVAEARYNELYRTRETLDAQMQEAHGELGKAKYRELSADLDRLGAERAKAEQVAEVARIAERDARAALPGKLAPQWPQLAQRAEAAYPAVSRPDPVVAMFDAYLALFDAIEAAQGRVPMVVGGINTGTLFEWNADRITHLLHKGVGGLDRHWMANIRTVRDAAKSGRY